MIRPDTALSPAAEPLAASPPPARDVAALQMLYAPIAAELAEAEAILQSELASDDPFVDELVKYGFLLGGKRLRPALLLLAGKATGRVTRDHLVLAAVVEMIHTATLIHDDVLDEAQVRRRLATVNARWDNEASVLLGDFLFTHAFHLASTLDSTYACRTIGRATNKVCEGELRQKGSRGDYRLTEQVYLEIIEAKTAELCACACELGAHAAGADADTVARLAGYGRDLGVAFQIIDDLLDVTGAEHNAGKSLGTDLEKQKPTLPIIRLLEVATPADRERILPLLTGDAPDRRAALSPWLEGSGAIEYAHQRAREYAERAAAAIATLPASDAQQVLAGLPQFVVARSF